MNLDIKGKIKSHAIFLLTFFTLFGCYYPGSGGLESKLPFECNKRLPGWIPTVMSDEISNYTCEVWLFTRTFPFDTGAQVRIHKKNRLIFRGYVQSFYYYYGGEDFFTDFSFTEEYPYYQVVKINNLVEVIRLEKTKGVLVEDEVFRGQVIKFLKLWEIQNKKS